jgi:cytosine/adenosine deaminase-related metal-dependent hydrolase
MRYDLVLRNGRAIDPESGLDALADVGITGRTVSKVAVGIPDDGSPSVDIRGMVIAPGFIDLHSHASSIAGQRLQACDGVTTALDLEAGESPLTAAYARAISEGRPINYGFSASWALSRMAQIGGIRLDGRQVFRQHIGVAAWQRPAGPAEVSKVLEAICADLDRGGIGIGVLLGYAPRIDPAEYLAVARLAAERGVPVFTHTRALAELAPDLPIDGAEELTRAAETTGAHMHYCHINSTSRRFLERVYGEVNRASTAGATVTTEAYPYGAGATGIGATFLDPANLDRIGIKTTDITYVPTGERVRDAARLAELRATDPGGLAIHDFLDEDDPADRALMLLPLRTAGTMVASDAMPLEWLGPEPDPRAWPLPDHGVTHPRTAGTFARAVRLLTRELGYPVTEAIRRCSLLPAKVLEASVPAMRAKGRLRQGSDADLVVFDPDVISERSTYRASTRQSAGIHHVLVNGSFVVRDGHVIQDAYPGQPLYASTR